MSLTDVHLSKNHYSSNGTKELTVVTDMPDMWLVPSTIALPITLASPDIEA
jgi:hypothetical protein